MQTIYIDIQAGEGGEDSKLFVEDLATAYWHYARNLGFSCQTLNYISGKSTQKITGKKALDYFKSESGKHVVQRVPPTERNGRRHTSVITVAIRTDWTYEWKLDESQVKIETKRGSGPGGQHKNKTESCVVATHIPTGISVKIDSRSQHQNKKLALKLLSEKIKEFNISKIKEKQSQIKSEQVDFGNRSNKIRTYNFINSRVTDHITGKKTSKIHDVLEKGRFDLIK